jgi:hypothetical protein
LTYRALAVGIPLVLVDLACASKTCNVCGNPGIRNGKSFKCPACGWGGDADLNGAQNIAFLGRYVVRPGGSEELTSIKAVLSGLQKAIFLYGEGRLRLYPLHPLHSLAIQLVSGIKEPLLEAARARRLFGCYLGCNLIAGQAGSRGADHVHFHR